MSRPLRIEFPGAVYHVTSRGDRREPIFADDEDRSRLLEITGDTLLWADARMLAYCLMGNHYHFVIRTRRANLSRTMRQINGRYSQVFNRRHGLSGHVFQGRYHSVIVDRDNYLLEVCRYVEMNPVRARLASDPGDWKWSSYAAHSGNAPSPGWLDTTDVLGLLHGGPISCAAEFRAAANRYAAFVASASGPSVWESGLRRQIYLGDEAFIEDAIARASQARLEAIDIPRAQRLLTTRVQDWLARATSQEEAFLLAHREGGLSMTRIARESGLSRATVARRIECARLNNERPDPGKSER
jgi:REP element-mobilizing transposase RayT